MAKSVKLGIEIQNPIYREVAKHVKSDSVEVRQDEYACVGNRTLDFKKVYGK